LFVGVFELKKIEKYVQSWRYSKLEQRMAKARIKAQLFGCCWAGEAFSLVRITFRKQLREGKDATL